MRTIFSLIFLGYGISIMFRRNQDIKGLSKFRFTYAINEFSDWQIALRLFYKYTFIFRLNLNR